MLRNIKKERRSSNLATTNGSTTLTEKGSSFGLNLGGGAGGSSSGSFGVNYSSNKTDRLWTDNQTSIIGTNSIEINTINKPT